MPPKKSKIHVRRKPQDAITKLREELLTTDVSDVEAWTVDDVNTNFLEKLGLSRLVHQFREQRITGHVLLTLTKNDLFELSPGVVGDVLLIDESLKFLRQRVRKGNREKLLWYGRWPDGGCAYYDSGKQCCVYTLFGWCLPTVDYRFTQGGILVKSRPPQFNLCCYPMYNDNSDYRFMKNIESYRGPTCCACCMRQGLKLTFDSKDDNDRGIDAMKPQVVCARARDPSSHIIDVSHPQLNDSKRQEIQEAWQNSRLVSD
mmetsp:Transcript_14731/g.43577  ORF Transcript_14731/g.43577 Transcript_14731/m.43577 type:complete len:259 (+) Transcript_14731:60-836(+)